MNWDTETVIDISDDSQESSPQGIEVPIDQLNPETLRNVISEFVTREWEEMGSVSYSLEQKIDQVMAQLNKGTAKLVFDQLTNSCNIIPVS